MLQVKSYFEFSNSKYVKKIKKKYGTAHTDLVRYCKPKSTR